MKAKKRTLGLFPTDGFRAYPAFEILRVYLIARNCSNIWVMSVVFWNSFQSGSIVREEKLL